MNDSLFDLLDVYDIAATTTQNVADTSRHDAARQAAQKGIESAAEHADPEWTTAALDAIRDMPAGRRFLAEEIVCALRERGIETYDARAAGAVIRAAKSHKMIESCGARPAASSHGSLKYLWVRKEGVIRERGS
jgi:hypothetical protein